MGDPSDPQEARAQARVGTTINGKYRLDRVLGVGGMAVVYAATHRNSKRFAVKMLHAEMSMNADIRTRFLREGYVACRVEHPGAVEVLDDDVAEDGSAFLVMELLEGATVEHLWEQASGRLPLGVVLCMTDALLDVLASAHERGIVHRDVKPANLFVTRTGELKVLDFGIARLRDTGALANATRTGTTMGTPAFMAPEQALGKASLIDAQSDVYAVGATAYTLLSGRVVHEAESLQEMMVFCATRQAPSLASVVPDAPPAIVGLVDRALAFHKAQRWRSALEMRDAVREAHRALFREVPSTAALAARVWAKTAAPAPAVVYSPKTAPMPPNAPAPPAPAPAPPPPRAETPVPAPASAPRDDRRPSAASHPTVAVEDAVFPLSGPSGAAPSAPRAWVPPDGGTTVKPVSAPPPMPPMHSSRTTLLAIVAVLTLGAAAVAVFFALRTPDGASDARDPASAPATTTVAPAAPSTATATTSAPVATAPSATSAAATTASTPPAPLTATTAAPPPPATTTAPKPIPTTKPTVAVDPCSVPQYRALHPEKCP